VLTCKRLAELDDFVQNLWNIHLDLQDEGGYSQPLSLGLFRSDYMVHLDQSPQSKPQIRQVEFNTIASSFGGLSTRAAKIHRHLFSSHSYARETESPLSLDSLPESKAAPGLAIGLAQGHQAYLTTTAGARDVCILFVVQANERNIFDQKHIENELVDVHHIPVFRVVFDTILSETSIDPRTHALLYPDPISGRTFEVSVLYYRAGYSPNEYQTESDWEARRELERTRAIKCPSVLTQLAGMKKVQQVLAAPNATHLSRFLPNTPQPSIDALQRTFAPMYPLDDTPAGQQGRTLATNERTASRFVLKPQREGGGNNIYRAAIPGFLESRPPREWDAYILMEMIEPPAQRNAIIRDGGAVVEEGGVICELGIYGTCLWEQHGANAGVKVLHNATAGYLLRTKGDQSEEGGVAAGFGALDSPCLVPDSALSSQRLN
jgi:glutathione synthetase